MGIFIQEDTFYNEYDRQVGFNRYKQLISRHWGDWIKVNLLTLVGILPLAFGISLSLMNSSLVLLIPLSLLGGMIYGPFLSAIFDAMLRAMRDDQTHWWKSYKKSWKQNLKGSLIPGALAGLVIGVYCFIAMLMWYAQIPPTIVTILLLVFSGLVLLVAFQLYFTQLVLFDQPAFVRIRNILLFVMLNFWRVFGSALLELLYWAVYVLLVPWTLLLLPFLGIWYILFVSEFLIYDQLDGAFQIEELFRQAGKLPD